MFQVCESREAQEQFNALIKLMIESMIDEIVIDRFIDGIEACFDKIAQFPEMFPYHHNPMIRRLGYRKTFFKHYIILYSVDSTEETVYIRGIFNGHTNYETYFL